MKKHLTYITISLLALTSCANQKQKPDMATTSTQESQQVPENETNFETLYYSNHGGKEKAEKKIINDPFLFSAEWQESNKNSYPPKETPKVDFKNKSIILIHFGQSNYGVPKKTLENVQVDEKQCTITLSTPPPSADPTTEYHTMEISNPVIFILVDKISEELPIEVKHELKEQ